LTARPRIGALINHSNLAAAQLAEVDSVDDGEEAEWRFPKVQFAVHGSGPGVDDESANPHRIDGVAINRQRLQPSGKPILHHIGRVYSLPRRNLFHHASEAPDWRRVRAVVARVQSSHRILDYGQVANSKHLFRVDGPKPRAALTG